MKTPSREEVKSVLSKANQHAAPGTDGLTAFFYNQCFHVIDEALTEVVEAVFLGAQPTVSQRTSRMVFGCKPRKAGSTKPSDN